MTRTLSVCALLAALALPCRADKVVSNSETLIRLGVQPARTPRPALRYLLLPELEEMNPGNPCYHYAKCFMDRQKFFFDKESVQRREKLLAMPLAELPAKELRDYGGTALSQADWAARLDAPDWQVLARLKLEGAAVLVSDVQELRPLVAALKVRFRAEAAEGRFEAALRTAKTMLAIARHLGKHATVVGNLEGYVAASHALDPLEEMLEQPGCPNLYWALTNLPHPLVSLEEGVRGERDIFVGLFRGLDDKAPMSEDQIKRFIAPLDGSLAGGKPVKSGGVRAFLDQRTRDEEALLAARGRLVEFGLAEGRLLRFPADQVILLDEKREYEVRRDEILKLMSLPMLQTIPLLARITPSKAPTLFAEPLTEALEWINRPQARLAQRIGLLRHVEALRLYAADHDGTLPARLSDLNVPLPEDPFTGKPFRYEVKGSIAHLLGTPPPGEEKNPAYNLHYEVTLRK